MLSATYWRRFGLAILLIRIQPLKSILVTKRHWQATYGAIPKEINPEAHRSVASMLEDLMKRFADKPAFRCLGQTVSYADVDRQSRAFAAYLQNRLGVKKELR